MIDTDMGAIAAPYIPNAGIRNKQSTTLTTREARETAKFDFTARQAQRRFVHDDRSALKTNYMASIRNGPTASR